MATTSELLERFVRANRRRSFRIERRSARSRPKLQTTYAEVVAALVDARPHQRVVDLGAGRSSHFVGLCDPELGTEVIGIDVSEEQLRHNEDLDVKLVIEPGDPLPLASSSVDLVTSRATLEHIRQVEPVLAEAHRVLVPGGYTVHLFPSKWAPFSLLNRLLPHRVSAALLRTFVPGSEGRLGFRAYYDHCTAGGMERLLRRRGFDVVETQVSYAQSQYFSFLVPLFLLSTAFERVIETLGLRPLAATVLIVAVKPADGAADAAH